MNEELTMLEAMTIDERYTFLLDRDIELETYNLEKLISSIEFFTHEIAVCKRKAREYLEDEDERAADYADYASTFTKHRVELRTQVREVRERIRWLRKLKNSRRLNSKEQQDS